MHGNALSVCRASQDALPFRWEIGLQQKLLRFLSYNPSFARQRKRKCPIHWGLLQHAVSLHRSRWQLVDGKNEVKDALKQKFKVTQVNHLHDLTAVLDDVPLCDRSRSGNGKFIKVS